MQNNCKGFYYKKGGRRARGHQEMYDRVNNTPGITPDEVYELMLPLIKLRMSQLLPNVKTNAIGYNDLLQQAYIWIHEACGRYNPQRGTALTSWIFRYIDHQFISYIAKHNPGRRTDHNRRKLIHRIEKTYERLYGKPINRRDLVVILTRYLNRKATKAKRKKYSVASDLREHFKAERHFEVSAVTSNSWDEPESIRRPVIPHNGFIDDDLQLSTDYSQILVLAIFSQISEIIRTVNQEIRAVISANMPRDSKDILLRKLIAFKLHILGIPVADIAPFVQYSVKNLKKNHFPYIAREIFQRTFDMKFVREYIGWISDVIVGVDTVLSTLSKQELSVLVGVSMKVQHSAQKSIQDYGPKELMQKLIVSGSALKTSNN